MDEYSAPVVRVQLVEERRLPIYASSVSSVQDAATALRALIGDYDREAFAAVTLDVQNRILGFNVVSVGTLNSSIVHPREVFKPAILQNAASVILAHNHPAGSTTPSHEDRLVTNRLVDAGKLLGIDVVDHLIITDQDYASMRLLGMM